MLSRQNLYVTTTEICTAGIGGDCSGARRLRRQSVEFDAKPPLEFDRHLALSRVDSISQSGSQRWMARVAVSRFAQPDFVYSIYPGFSSTLDVDSDGVAIAHVWVLNPRTHNELRFGFRDAGRVGIGRIPMYPCFRQRSIMTR